MADRNSPIFSYRLPVLVRVLSNPLKTKQNLPDYNIYICKGSEEPNPNYKIHRNPVTGIHNILPT